jgi:hypothetical protein
MIKLMDRFAIVVIVVGFGFAALMLMRAIGFLD